MVKARYRLEMHVRQHYWASFCQCGYGHYCRDNVLMHVRTAHYSDRNNGGPQRPIYEVDPQSFDRWKQSVNLIEAKYPKLRPRTLRLVSCRVILEKLPKIPSSAPYSPPTEASTSHSSPTAELTRMKKKRSKLNRTCEL